MEELIGRITGNAGIDASTARRAVGIIVSFLYQESDREKVAALVQRIPGLEAVVETSADNSAATLGGLGGLMGGGAMAVLGKLQALGLGMGEIQAVTRETVHFAREKAGAEIVDDMVGSIPGLSQFI